MATQPLTTPTSRDYAQTNVQLYEQLWQADYSLEEARKVKDAYDLAQQLFSGIFRGSGRPFLAHLVGTASILVKHGASGDVVVAGLLHAAYEFGNFGHGLWRANKAKRQILLNAVGTDVEPIVYNYAANRVPVAQACDMVMGAEGLSALNRTTFLIRLANHLEDALLDNYNYSGVGKKNQLTSSLPLYIHLAKAMGHIKLADELSLCLDAIKSSVTQENLLGVTASYKATPLSYRQRTRPWMFDMARVCRNFLTKHLPTNTQKKD